MHEVKIFYFNKLALENTEICEYACVVYESPVADLHSKILDAPPSRSNFIHFYAVFKFYFTKQDSIPVGCILPAFHRVCVCGGGSLSGRSGQ